MSYKLFDYIITFVNSQHKNTNSKGGFVLKNWFLTFVLRFVVYKNKSDSDLVRRIQLINIKG
jgi:hypothetical protein